jgi:hypothetical protein
MLENKTKLTFGEQEEVINDLILVRTQQHCRVQRTEVFGEVVEADASEFCFFGDKKVFIHIFVDRATNKILGA